MLTLRDSLPRDALRPPRAPKTIRFSLDHLQFVEEGLAGSLSDKKNTFHKEFTNIHISCLRGQIPPLSVPCIGER